MKSNCLSQFQRNLKSHGSTYTYYSLPALGVELPNPIHRLPICLRIVLESVLRNCDGKTITENDVRNLARWNAADPEPHEIPFRVGRILLQDFTGVPLLVDLAAMRSAVARFNRDPGLIEPLVPVDLVIDHSVQVDFAGSSTAFEQNLEMEFRRNRERYQFLKWGQQSFNNFRVIPPAIGIVHQVNLEYLARGVIVQNTDSDSALAFPDTLVGTDSHTTMVNGLGIVGWGVGGIEAEAGMLGQPIYMLNPAVVGVHLKGRLREGVTATDLALRITQLLREKKVVGKFVEFYGPGARSLSLADRAPIANMAPEYGATIGFFPLDQRTLDYFADTGRPAEHVSLIKDYFEAQRMFGIPDRGEIDYSVDLELDLDTVEPSVSGPKRPQDRIRLSDLKERFRELLIKPVDQGGYGKPSIHTAARVSIQLPADLRAAVVKAVPGGGSQEPVEVADAQQKNTNPLTELEMANNRPTPDRCEELTPDLSRANGSERIDHGAVLIAAITSCTNTSNPSLMMAAGLLARNAVRRGLRVDTRVKASLAPGSRVVSQYLEQTGLQKDLDQLGFNLVGYGCTTCIGNSGPLPAAIEQSVRQNDVIAASVLSGNRNFEARIHQSIRANFLMSPPLVVAFALAGSVDIDLTREPIGESPDGEPVFLRDIWPSDAEVEELLRRVLKPESYRQLYEGVDNKNSAWNEIPAPSGKLYSWDTNSTYIQEPPFFEEFSFEPCQIQPLKDARALAILGDSVTTDHISPAGSIKVDSPAGIYLRSKGVAHEDFNSYGSRRGNDRVMTRGTFANVRIRNCMAPGTEGPFTRNVETGEIVPIYDAAMFYKQRGIPLVVIGGKEYGTGSSRDWAAKGTRLLGVRAVLAESFERIHRSNLVGVGVLPCTFPDGANAELLNLNGSETFGIPSLNNSIQPHQKVELVIVRHNGRRESLPVILQIDTPTEVEYYRHGGILPYVLRHIVQQSG